MLQQREQYVLDLDIDQDKGFGKQIVDTAFNMEGERIFKLIHCTRMKIIVILKKKNRISFLQTLAEIVDMFVNYLNDIDVPVCTRV